jgi:hypothetical protein
MYGYPVGLGELGGGEALHARSGWVSVREGLVEREKGKEGKAWGKGLDLRHGYAF